MVGSTPDKKAKKKKSPPVRVRDVVPEVDHRSRKAKIEFTVPLRILDMTAQVTSTTTFAEVEQMIRKKYGGSLVDLSLCIGPYSPQDAVRPTDVFGESRITSAEVDITYDFIAQCDPMLE